ncbi:hypothetical protein EJ04DRAFT_550255 [Polyplosphaeria fusca]|uniref:Uncharacterized protein n=1 Tax=Polyplosphaeria fusca TaxID=682080 RepID=A0A9P4R6R5_9PLEO|nr:hypothetical protein EJ04DRAFT_550255 [Polyplosphaeria fusca]
MTSGTVSLFSLLCLLLPSLAQEQVQFNQVLNLNGDMDLNSFVFPDRSKIETFSQSQQQLIVNQQTPAVPANQVTGSTGQPFVALMQQSMSVNTNGATDLVGGQIELIMDQQMLQQNAVNPDNTYVGQLSPDRQSWMIIEPMRSVNITDTTVRIQKMNSIDGEYIALGRQTVETNNVLVPFKDQSVVIQGTGLQENEFVDGLRVSTRATQPMSFTVDVKDGVEQGMLTQLQGQQPINDFRYTVTSNLAGVQPDLSRMAAVMQIPLNVQRVQQMMQAQGAQSGQIQIGVAQRAVLGNPGGATGQLQAIGQTAPQRRARDQYRRMLLERQVAPATGQITGQTAGQTTGQTTDQTQNGGTPTSNNPVATELLLEPTFTPIQANAVFDPNNMRVAIPVTQIDGEFILTMSMGGAAAPPEQQAQGEQQPAASNGTTPAEAGEVPEAAASSAPEAPKAAERRQEAESQKGYVALSVDEINRMAETQKWGGMPPVTRMMEEYAKDMGVTLQSI